MFYIGMLKERKNKILATKEETNKFVYLLVCCLLGRYLSPYHICPTRLRSWLSPLKPTWKKPSVVASNLWSQCWEGKQSDPWGSLPKQPDRPTLSGELRTSEAPYLKNRDSGTTARTLEVALCPSHVLHAYLSTYTYTHKWICIPHILNRNRSMREHHIVQTFSLCWTLPLNQTSFAWVELFCPHPFRWF